MLDWQFDESYKQAYAVVAGTDEAGRGPLAGPVVAGAVILPDGLVLEGLDDSKKLTEKKRERLYAEITEKAVSWAVALATPAEIDEYNILNASQLAMRRALDALQPKPDFALVDGNVCRSFPMAAQCVIGGDAKSPSIAAASVLAKVTRDRMLVELDEAYPQYGFKKHKGYPTKEHMLAVYRFGPCPEHRRSFLGFLEKDAAKLAAMAAAEGGNT